MQPNFTLKNWVKCLRIVPMLFVLLGLGAGKANAQCTWTASSVYPIVIQDQQAAGVGNTLYSFGGYSNAVATTNSYKFDGAAWTPIAALPQALIAGGCVSDGTDVYIVGGYAGSAQPVLYRYNVALNTYTTLAPAPTATISSAVTLVGGKIYKVAGAIDGAGTATAIVNIYDIASNTWTTGAPYPAATTWARAYGQGNFVYVAGGIAGVPTLKAYRYDIGANTWDDAAMTDLPQTRWGATAGFYNGGFVNAGGVVNGNAIANISNTVVSYDVAGNNWTTLPNMTGERYRGAAGTITSGFYSVGGVSQTSTAFNGTNINQRLECIALSPCTGTPNPGNTLSSLPTVCPGISFVLSPQNTTPGSGVTYQWQSGPSATGPWVNMGTGSTQTTTQTAATFYQVIVTCSGNSTTSTPIQVLLTPPSGCYCDAGATSTAFEKISNVTFGTINNNSASTAGYENFTALSTTVIKGQTLPLSVTLAGGFPEDQILVWIDFNQNGNFSDPGENVVTTAQGGPFTNMPVTISPTASTGSTRMRIRMHDATLGPNTTPCGNSTYGQVEDYTVNIVPCVQGVFTSGPASTSIQCSGNASFVVTTTGSALTYKWEYRINSSSPWLNVPNAAPYSGVNSTTLTLLNVPSTMNGYQYRAVMEGPCTAVDFSPVATLTVTPLVATVTPTSATLCLGGIQQLTLTNPTSTPIYGLPSGLPLAIPDATATGTTSTIMVSNVPPGAVVTNISVNFTINHTFVGDVDINLIAPNGGNLNLVGGLDNGTGSNGTDNWTNTTVSSTSVTPMSGVAAPRTGTFRADMLAGYGPTGNTQNTASWAGMTSTLNGPWTLAIADFFNLDVGTLTAWSINITYVAPPAQGIWGQETPAATVPNTTIYTDALATVPYTGTPANTVYVKPTVNTTYSVIYSTPTPCTSAKTLIPVNVVTPISNVVSPVNTTVCAGTNASFTVGASGGPFTRQWEQSIDAGLTWTPIAGATAATLTLTNVTTSMTGYRYRAVLTAAPCAGTSTSNAAILTVNALPNVAISSPDLSITPGSNQNTTITATSNPAASVGGWSWTLNGSPIAGTTNTQTVDIDGLGVYRARVVDVNGCIAFSNELTIGAEASDRLWIYPNPSAGAFQVRLYYGGPVTERRVVRIYKSNGQLVMEKEFTLGNVVSPYLRMDFDLSNLSGGTYVVKVDNTVTGKITSGLVVIQRENN